MNSRTTVLQVGGLNWATSAAIVEQALRRRPGVLAVEANAVAQTANVTYDPDRTGIAQLSGWVRDCGVLGLGNVTVAFAAMTGGVAGLATGTAAVLSNAQPLLILLPAWWLYGEAVSGRTAGALVVGFTGLVLVALPGEGGSGAALSLLAAVAITAGTLLARRLGGIDVVVAAGWHFVIGGAGLVVLAAAVEGAPVIAWTPRFVAALAFLALVGTAATTVVWFIEAGRSRLDILSAWTFLTPVFGIVLSAVVLGEVPAGWTAVGLVAVLVTMWVVLRPVSAWRSARRVGGLARGAGSQPVGPCKVEEQR